MPTINKILCLLAIFCASWLFSHATFADANPNCNEKQTPLISNINIYLVKHSEDQNFISKFEDGEDKGNEHNNGISTLWLLFNGTKPEEHYDWLISEIYPLVTWNGKKNWPQIDFSFEKKQNWFQYAVDLIVNWDGKRELDDKEKETFEVFITLIEFFENSMDYLSVPPISLDKILEQINGQELKREYSFTCPFTLEQLKKFLNTENMTQGDRLILIESMGGTTINLFKKGNLYHYFNPKKPTEEKEEASLDKIAELIFSANCLDNHEPFPLVLLIFSFDENPPLEYPSQRDLLTEIAPDVLNIDQNHMADTLALAIIANCSESLIYFLEKGADSNTQKKGATMLSLASYIGNHEAIDILLKNGADPTIKNENGATAYDFAVTYGHNNIANKLLENMIFHVASLTYRPNAYIGQNRINAKMASCVKHENKSLAVNFLTSGGHCAGYAGLWLQLKYRETQPFSKDEMKNYHNQFKSSTSSILGWNWPQIDQEEYEPTINYSWFNSTIHEPIDIGTIPEENRKDCEILALHIELLQNMSKHQPINQHEYEKTLGVLTGEKIAQEYSIASLFTLEQLKKLLKEENIIQNRKMISIHSHSHATALFKDGETFLYYDPNSKTGEIETRSLDEIAELIFEANSFDHSNPSPLAFKIFSPHGASCTKYSSPQNILRKLKPNLGTQKDYAEGHSGLTMAAKINCLESAQYFLEKGTDPNVQTETNSTALIMSSTLEYFEIVKLLLENGADPDIQDDDGITALMAAAYNRHFSIVKILLEKGADPNITNKHGYTALSYAKANGHIKIAEKIEKKIAELDNIDRILDEL